MFKHFERLPSDIEVGMVWWGQSNARPWGDRDTEGFASLPEMAVQASGIDLTILTASVVVSPASATEHGAVGTRSKLNVRETLATKQWVGATLRLAQTVFGITGQWLQKGHATVIDNDTSSLTVQWVSAFQSNSTAVALLENRSAYATLNGKFTGYDNVRVLTPYQPEQPGPYPAGVAVPGYTFPSAAPYEITVNDQAALWLPFCWNEGIDGPGYTTTISSGGGTLSLTLGTTSMVPDALIGGIARVIRNEAGKGVVAQGVITANTNAAITVSAWAGLAAADISLVSDGATVEINLPHWRDNPNPLGYRYPSNDHQPGANGGDGAAQTELGHTYNRARHTLSGETRFLTPSYVATNESTPAVRTSDIATGVAEFVATGVNLTVASPTSGALRISTRFPFAFVDADVNTGTDTISVVDHGMANGTPVFLENTGGALPTGLSLLTTYYVRDSASGSFKLAATPGGAAVNITAAAGGGTHTVMPTIVFSFTDSVVSTSTSTIVVAANLPNGTPVRFTNSGGGLPGSLVAGTTYYIINSTATSFQVSLAVGGSAVPLSTLSLGTHTMTSLARTGYGAGRQQFTSWLAQGQIVKLSGWGISGAVDINTYTYRVTDVAAGANGTTYVDLEATPAATWNPLDVNAVCLTGTKVTQRTRTLRHRFGCMVAAAWKLATLIGRRVHVVHLGVNGSSQYLASNSNSVAFKGELGWWDDNDHFDWTPSNPNGNAARLARMIQEMVPSALLAEGNTKPWRCLVQVGFQGEAEAWSDTWRSSYGKLLTTFYGWLRKVLAPFSPYAANVKIPAVHAELSKNPWQLTSFPGYGQTLNGDVDGLVNAAINEWATRDGAAATFSTTTVPYTDGIDPLHLNNVWGLDPLHFNGFGEALNAGYTVDAALPLISDALSQGFDAAAFAICNEALVHIGEARQITSFTDQTVEAQKAAVLYPACVDELLESHAWTFALKRVALDAVENTATSYQYAYARPADVLKALIVLPQDAPDDFGSGATSEVYPVWPVSQLLGGQRKEIPYITERDTDGTLVIRTNLENAHFRYIARVNDVAQFTPGFRRALVLKLAAKFAGALVKGEVGAAMERRLAVAGELAAGQAKAQDASQAVVPPPHVPDWIAAREKW